MTPLPPNTYSLVADIGGTNTRVALARGVDLLDGSTRKFSNAKYPGLETVLRDYIAEMGDVDCTGACVAVAGPVRDGVGTLTNLDWTMDEATLARATQAENVAILNDLQAQAHALGHIEADKLPTVIAGPEAAANATRLVIGIGTGFNAAPVFETAQGRLVPPSECGHANLPIRTEAELRLCQFVETAHGFPAVEDVLSGRGLERVYAWLASEAGTPGEANAADIVGAAERGDDPLAEAAIAQFVRIMGTVAGNLSLIYLPFGGVYLAGGVARHMAPYLARYGFQEAFRDKGRFAGFMQNFGVSIIDDDFAALTGCAAHLTQLTA